MSAKSMVSPISIASELGQLPEDSAGITCVALFDGLRLNQMTNLLFCEHSAPVHGLHGREANPKK
jgi:hypothetical protein